jgi:peptidoglycan/LPS O-acetylase OafA/YrhL
VDGTESDFMQRPILRLVAQGNAWVAVFFILLGYVNSLKCIQQSRAGQTDAALSVLASSAFKRTGRVIFPAAAVTMLTWLACQLGAFQLSRGSDAYWLRTTSPEPSPTWISALHDLGRELIATWFWFSNRYDQPQWALMFLLKGSLFVFMVLLITVRTTPRFRIFAELVLYVWSWSIGDFLVGTNVFAGMVLAELTMCDFPRVEIAIVKCIPFVSSAFGLLLMSFPNEYYDWAPWSRKLHELGSFVFPSGVEFGRAWPGIGAQILCYSVCFSASLRQAMSRKFLLWLGGASYSLYLLHGPLMRSVLAWLVFGPMMVVGERVSGEDGNYTAEGSGGYVALPGWPFFVLVLPVFWAFLVLTVHLWNSKVEPKFAVATKWLEELALGERRTGSDSNVLLPTHRSQAN